MHDQPLSEPTFAVATLGCKVNQADSEAIGEQMSAAGFMQRNFDEIADIYIVNTCTVTHLGDRSSRSMISQARRRHPDALLVVTGCYAEMNPQAVKALPGVDVVIGNSGKDSLAEAIQAQWQASKSSPVMPELKTTVEKQGEEHGCAVTDVGAQSIAPLHLSPHNHAPHPEEQTSQRLLLPVLPLDTQHIGSDTALIADAVDYMESEPLPENPSPFSPFTAEMDSDQTRHLLKSRTRVQMKVQDGCDNRCTYCIVPYVRGKSRSRSIESIVEHVQRKTRAGFQEIVLTGIHLGDFHPDDNEERNLGDLIATLLSETEMPRIRVSSLEPEDFRLEWLELWENPRMCRHLHLPMQSGSDAVLRRMARRYNSTRYQTIVTTAKQLVPGIAISTDIITGFPGESDEDFEQTYQLARELQFAKAHVFRFSARQGTAAARMKGQIKDEMKKARSERLLRLNEEHSRLFRQQFLDETVQVLIENRKRDHWEGLTDNYLRVEVEGLPETETHNWSNTLVKARLTQLVEDGVSGIMAE